MTWWMGGPLVPPLEELRDVLNGHGAERLDDDSALSLVQSLAEARGWLTDHRSFDYANHAPAWKSAFDDLHESVRRVGTRLSSLLTELPALVNLANNLIPHTKAAPSPIERTRVLKLVDDCLHVLREPSALSAAFQDLVASCSKQTSSPGRIASQRDLLHDMIEHSGKDSQHVFSEVISILASGCRPLDRFTRDEPVWAEISPPETKELIRERLALAENYIVRPEAPAHQIVWLIFAPAWIKDWKYEVGPVTLYRSSTIGSVLRDRVVDEQIPPELRGEFWKEERFGKLFSTENTVAVRVDLGVRTAGHSIRTAQNTARALLAIGKFASSTRFWHATGTYLHFEDGHLRAESHGGHASPESFYSFHQDHVLSAIDSQQAEISAQLLHMSDKFQAVVEALEWWQAAQESPIPARIILDVRVLELVSSQVGARDWVKFITDSFELPWVRACLYKEISEIASIAGDRTHYKDSADEADMQRLHSQIVSITGQYNDRITIDRDLILRSLPQIANQTRSETYKARKLRSVMQWTRSEQALNSRRQVVNKEWSQSVQRLLRVRNALTHGGPTTTPISASVVDFADALSAWAISLALEAVLAGKDVRTMFSEYSVRQAEIEARTTEPGDNQFRLIVG